ncbi:MAG: UDP-N-acetylmuramate/alanine ligase [Solirubrobacterales bacterium]|nr:UDP-N-acetylmuramate/alanine ligase [Solirubrobacterales bacterium]
MIGVGGAGMSAYARAAHALGAEVSGSDGADSDYARRLAADGVLQAAIGHSPENVPGGEGVEVYFSSAVAEQNVERVAARERGLPERSRAELLGELSALRRTIAVAGTHGKTTTASMIARALLAAGMQPGWLIGAPIGGGLANAEWGEGEWLVVEADESDRSMLSLDVEIAVLTNVELDHHASFASLAELREVFRSFLSGASEAVLWDRQELLALRDGPLVAYDAQHVELTEGGSRFQWRGHDVELSVPGLHNALDATGALEASRLAGAPPEAAIAALAEFSGAGRRFQPLGRSERGARLFEDYAHHPTEVAATLRAARTLPHERLVAVFQPHLFSRTKLLAREFGVALAEADVIAVLDVYPARERQADFPGVSGLLIAEAAADAARGRPVYWLPGFTAARTVLAGMLAEGDLCVVMGAGDVEQLGRDLAANSEAPAGEGGADEEAAA